MSNFIMHHKARLWAANERENVQNWAEQQRSLIKKERKRVMNDVLSSQRKKRQQEHEERAAAAAMDSQKQLRDEVEALETTLQKQKVDHDMVKSRFRLNEKKLRNLISEREKTIELLRKDIEKLNTKHTRIQEERNDLLKYKEDSSRKKKKGKKKKEKSKFNQSPTLEKCQTHKDKKAPIGDSSIDEDTPISKGEIIDSTDPQDEEENTKKLGECQEQCDEEAIRIITTRHDLVEKPTEEWLQKHLQELQSGETEKKMMNDQDFSFITPVKGKTYNPEKYGNTPHQSAREDNLPESSKYEVNQVEKSVSQNSNMQRSAVKYRNGTQKEILPDGTIIVKFTNGDTKTTYSNIGIVVYYYTESKVNTQTLKLVACDDLLIILLNDMSSYPSYNCKDITHYSSRWT